MKYISAIIKGGPVEVQQAADQRKVPVEIITQTRQGECRCHIPWEYHNAVVKWYEEDTGSGAPYPAGSVLLFSEREQTG